MRKAARKVLVTGFEPFDGATVNPSAEIARTLHGRRISGREITGVVLPCCFGLAIRQLKRHLRSLDAELVVCLGQAGGRAEITPERIAINIDDARIPDNAGRQPVDAPIVKGGTAAYWSTLPVKAIVEVLRSRGIPASVSQSAGTFVCNHVFYGLMHALAGMRRVRGGFVHLPYQTGQAGEDQPAMPLDVMVDAVGEIISVSLANKRDIRSGGGHTH